MAGITFRNSKLVYYGPYACETCGEEICKMAFESGGNAFTYPKGPIYPNTEWHVHVCDPKQIAFIKAFKAGVVDIPKDSPHVAAVYF